MKYTIVYQRLFFNPVPRHDTFLEDEQAKCVTYAIDCTVS